MRGTSPLDSPLCHRVVYRIHAYLKTLLEGMQLPLAGPDLQKVSGTRYDAVIQERIC